MAVRNSGGLVIVQVERIAEAGASTRIKSVLPAPLVDCIVVAPAGERTCRPCDRLFPPSPGRSAFPRARFRRLPLDDRKVIARRFAFELPA